MSLTIGRIGLEPPDAWPEPIGEQVQRVGGVPTPGARGGTTVNARITLAPPDTGVKAARQRVRRQVRSLANNPAARLQSVWVAWADDDEQDGWYVPSQATIDLAEGALASGFFTTSLGLELVGRPRTHRRAVLARTRDLRLATEPKDLLGRVYGRIFDGSGSVGSAVTPAPVVWLPSGVSDVVAHSGGSPTLGTAISGRDATSLTPVSGLSDLAVVSCEQPSAHRHRGDVVIYDRRGETGTPPSTGPHSTWEEVYGADWPWAGLPALENYVARVAVTTGGVISLAYWDGSAFTEYTVADVRARVSSTDYTLDTILSVGVHEWTPDRGVVRLVMEKSGQDGTRCDVYLTLQRGWLGPRIEVYPSTSGQTVKVALDPAGSISVSDMPSSHTSSANHGYTAATHGVVAAVVQPSAGWAPVAGGYELAAAGYVSVHLSRCAPADVSTARAALGALVLSDARYPQTIVPR